jgi:uncharacterized HAD superfamily protein
LPICTVQEFAKGLAPQCGTTRNPKVKVETARRILLVDDSIWTGTSMANALAHVSAAPEVGSIMTCAVFSTCSNHSGCDLIFEVLEPPRLFEWNLFHRKATGKMGFDIDGVLCRDPNSYENDDGPRYQQFIKTSAPLITPTYPIGGVASNRLSKYEAETKQWLADCGIDCSDAFFHTASNAEARRSSGDYVSIKSAAYSSKDWILFIESDKKQAIEICNRTSKPVYCYENGIVYYPNRLLHWFMSAQQIFYNIIQRYMNMLISKIRAFSRS